LLEPIKKVIQLFFAGRQKIRSHRMRLINDLTDVSQLALFFCINTKEELKEIADFLVKIKTPGKQVTAYVFCPAYDTLDVVTDKSILFFNLTDFTIFAKMKEELKSNIQDLSFELMVSFVRTSNPFCHFLLAEINADFKVGPNNPDMTNVYDLCVKYDTDNLGFAHFHQQVMHYLSVLNIEAKHN